MFGQKTVQTIFSNPICEMLKVFDVLVILWPACDALVHFLFLAESACCVYIWDILSSTWAQDWLLFSKRVWCISQARDNPIVIITIKIHKAIQIATLIQHNLSLKASASCSSDGFIATSAGKTSRISTIPIWLESPQLALQNETSCAVCARIVLTRANENRKVHYHIYHDYMLEFISSTLRTRLRLASTKSLYSKPTHKCAPLLYTNAW